MAYSRTVVSKLRGVHEPPVLYLKLADGSHHAATGADSSLKIVGEDARCAGSPRCARAPSRGSQATPTGFGARSTTCVACFLWVIKLVICTNVGIYPINNKCVKVGTRGEERTKFIFDSMFNVRARAGNIVTSTVHFDKSPVHG